VKEAIAQIPVLDGLPIDVWMGRRARLQDKIVVIRGGTFDGRILVQGANTKMFAVDADQITPCWALYPDMVLYKKTMISTAKAPLDGATTQLELVEDPEPQPAPEPTSKWVVDFSKLPAGWERVLERYRQALEVENICQQERVALLAARAPLEPEYQQRVQQARDAYEKFMAEALKAYEAAVADIDNKLQHVEVHRASAAQALAETAGQLQNMGILPVAPPPAVVLPPPPAPPQFESVVADEDDVPAVLPKEIGLSSDMRHILDFMRKQADPDRSYTTEALSHAAGGLTYDRGRRALRDLRLAPEFRQVCLWTRNENGYNYRRIG